MRVLRWIVVVCVGIAACFILILGNPQPLFGHRVDYGQFQVWSDRPIDPEIRQVLEDATRRLRTSELYTPEQQFRIFICNESWRLALYSQRFSSGMAGVADDWLTRNIYLRSSDIAANQIIPPGPELRDAHVRPLSYFIAHEATHIMDSRAFGRLTALRHPSWLREGYADYVAKGGDFDYSENLARFRRNDPLLDPRRSGLYRRHHLIVATLLDLQGRSIREIYADPPSEEAILRTLLQ